MKDGKRQKPQKRRSAYVQKLANNDPIDLNRSIRQIKTMFKDPKNPEPASRSRTASPSVLHTPAALAAKEDLLAEHWQKYELSKEKAGVKPGPGGLPEYLKEYNYEEVLAQLQAHPIKCVKYNHSLDADIQNYLQFESLISVSECGQRLIITNKKPCENPDYILEADPYAIERERQIHK